MYSFVIKIAIDVNISVLDEKIPPTLGFNIANVLEHIVEADSIKFSVINNNILFFQLNFCISFYNSHYRL